MIEAIVVVILGIFAGAAILTMMPFYLKLKAIKEKADAEGVEPVLPKFGSFYIVSAGISIVIAGVMNLGLAQELAENNPNANFTQLFITSLLASAGSNAILNLIPKTGNSNTIKTETSKSGKTTISSDEEPSMLGGGLPKKS